MSASTSFSFKAYWVWGVSALALIAATADVHNAEASDLSGFTLDLQGMYDLDQTGASEVSLPGYKSTPGLSTAMHPGGGYDVGAKLTYQAPKSPYSFALGVRYGATSQSKRSVHFTTGSTGSSLSAEHRQEHAIVDFEVGKDVGLGLFGPGVTTVGGGLRYAHLDSTTRGSFQTFYSSTGTTGKFKIDRKSDMVGPRVFVRQTSALPGAYGKSGLAFGWGAGAAVLFGRQTTTESVAYAAYPPVRDSRARSETTMSLDGFVQLSWAPPKTAYSLSAGYRVDAFLNGMDGGLRTTHEINVIEQGPFVGISLRFK